jgi:tetratricopeptide (TPR) repeat protein
MAIKLSEKERTPYLLKLTRNDRTKKWEGEWHSRIEGAPEESALILAFPQASLDLTGKIADPGQRSADFGIPSSSFSASHPRATNKTYNGLIYPLHEGEMHIVLAATFPDKGPDAKDIYVPVLMSLDADGPGLYDKGSELLGTRNYKEALPKLEAAVRLAPDSYRAMNNLAWALVAIATTTNQTIDPRAIELAKAVVQLQPDVPTYLDTLAHAEYLSGNMTEALDAWTAVFRLNPLYVEKSTDPLCQKDRKVFQDLKRQRGIAK